MTNSDAGFEGLATQDSMRNFYGAMQDRVALEGAADNFSNLHMDLGPSVGFFEDAEGKTYTINLCHGAEIDIWVGEDLDPLKYGIYDLRLTNDSTYLGSMCMAAVDFDEYPLTELALQDLWGSISASGPTLHMTPQERASQDVVEGERLFAQYATPDEMARYVELGARVTEGDESPEGFKQAAAEAAALHDEVVRRAPPRL